MRGLERKRGVRVREKDRKGSNLEIKWELSELREVDSPMGMMSRMRRQRDVITDPPYPS